MNATAADQTATRTGVHRLTVLETQTVTPLMRRATVRAPTLTGLALYPAQDVGLVFTDDTGRQIRRRYTITRTDPVAETLVLDGVLHGDGPGANWFANAAAGVEVDVVGPRGQIRLAEDASWQLFVGDESGLPAFAELLAALPAGSRATAVVEVADAAERQSLASPGSVDVHWVHRDGRAPGMPAALIKALDGLARPDVGDGTARAYVLGESRAVVALGPALAALGINRAQTFVKGYWNRPRGL